MKCVFLSIGCAALSATPAVAYQAQALVAQYDLDEVTGRVVHDGSGNQQDGAVDQGVQLGEPGAQPETGRSARFNAASSGNASIVAAPALTYLRSNLSVAVWVRPDDNDELMRIFGNRGSGWSCARTGAGLRFTVRFVQDYLMDCDVPANRWTHVAFVFDAGFDVTFYVDGENLGTVSGIFPAYEPGPDWTIGSLDGTSQFWDGRLDDLQVYVGSLTPQQVRYLYENPGATIDPMVGVPYCFGDGHDAICPCYNYGGHDSGCRNSTGYGARLRSTGSARISVDDLRFTVNQVPAQQPALLFVADNATNGGKGTPFADGLRCAGGNVRRLGVRVSSMNGSAGWGPGLRTVGGWSAGSMKRFQAWYRDPQGTPCGTGANTSNGVQVSFLP